ncbi:hypothetical protein ACQ4PT_027061 [Festuca glaucescens]
MVLWALHRFPSKDDATAATFVLLHVYSKPRFIPVNASPVPCPLLFRGKMGTVSQVQEQQPVAYKKMELQKTSDILDERLLLCAYEKVQAEKLVVESDDVAQGLVKLISEHRVTELVMGAVADKHYTKNLLKNLTSLKINSRARDSENLYFGEVKQRNEIEEKLTTTMEEVERLTQTTDKLCAKLQEHSKKRLALEKRTAHSDRIIKDLMLQCDKAVREVEALHAKKGESSAAAEGTMHLTELSCSEITEATNNFDHSLKVGESVYGSVYKGFLRHTHVAIKKLNRENTQSQFNQEVEILSRVRHPNLVTLIGACKEDQALVYEYMPNGSLDDRLVCKNNSKPLRWQLRTRIISDVCSALIFLHSNKPHSIVHSDLKASNIILDGNNVAKLSGFGVCRMFTDEFRNTTTLYRHTHPKGSFVYIDPEHVMTGDLAPQSDVYSFGIVLLRLLTGRLGFGLLKDVQRAAEKDCLAAILDSSAGDCLAMQAEQLARVVSEDLGVVPSYFICPILQPKPVVFLA